MYSKKLFGINTLSCSEGSMGLRPEWPWTARRKRISCPDGSLQYWNIFLIPPPPAILLFHFSSDQCRECTRSFRRYSFFLQNSIAPSSSRGRSPWRKRYANKFLAQQGQRQRQGRPGRRQGQGWKERIVQESKERQSEKVLLLQQVRPCVSQILGGPMLRLGIPRERLSIPPGSRQGGSNAGWLGTWDSPLRTDSASWKSLESFIQLTSFCSSWILAVNSLIVSWFSINLLFENSSIRNSWTLFNSSISWKLLIWASRRFRFCSDNCSWRSWSRRSCSSLAIVWSISLRWDSIIPINSWILLLSESAWNSCLWISALKSARICSFCLSKRTLMVSFSISRLGFSLLHELSELSSCTGLSVLEWHREKDWAGNKLSPLEW